MLLAVSKVMLEMIALVLEDIVVFILDFPTSSTSGDHLDHIMFVDRMGSYPGITVNDLLFGIADGW